MSCEVLGYETQSCLRYDLIDKLGGTEIVDDGVRLLMRMQVPRVCTQFGNLQGEIGKPIPKKNT